MPIAMYIRLVITLPFFREEVRSKVRSSTANRTTIYREFKVQLVISAVVMLVSLVTLLIIFAWSR